MEQNYEYSFTKQKSNSSIVLTYTDDTTTDLKNYTLVLSAISNFNVNLRSSITTHPIVTGDQIADHMIKEPISISFSGSIEYRNGFNIPGIDSTGFYLTDVEKTFEKIKNDGFLCTLVKSTISGSNEIKFSVRKNMVLTSISWTENINTLDYTFSFSEALVADVDEPTTDPSDIYSPNVTEPTVSNFVSDFLGFSSEEEIRSLVLSVLYENDLVSDSFIEYMKKYNVGWLFAGAVGAAVVSTAALATTVAIVGATSAVFGPIGLMAGAIALVVVGMVGVGRAIYKAHKTSKFIKPFKDGNDEDRFNGLCKDIFNELKELNNSCQLYKISREEEHTAYLTVNDELYTFKFYENKNRVEKDEAKWLCDVEGEDEENNKSCYALLDRFNQYSDFTYSNALINFDSVSGIYLVRVNEDMTVENDDYTNDKLTSYGFLVTSIDLSKTTDILTEIIKNHLYRKAEES